jgi:hypothetical protein
MGAPTTGAGTAGSAGVRGGIGADAGAGDIAGSRNNQEAPATQPIMPQAKSVRRKSIECARCGMKPGKPPGKV